MSERPVFVVSDRTGVTAETLSHSLLTQFPGVRFRTTAIPFVDTDDKVSAAVAQIDSAAETFGSTPLVFTTFVDDAHRRKLQRARGVFLDIFETFLEPLERELGIRSSHSAGIAHGMVDIARYSSRINAVNYSVHCDDGINTADYDRADLILVGVSRCGKTPTCLYMALHFGIHAANYPLTEEDFERGRLPEVLRHNHDKLFGLTIEPARLHQIRQERRGNSRYSELKQCRQEVARAEALFRSEGLPVADATSMSIEEISTTIIHRLPLVRDAY